MPATLLLLGCVLWMSLGPSDGVIDGRAAAAAAAATLHANAIFLSNNECGLGVILECVVGLAQDCFVHLYGVTLQPLVLTRPDRQWVKQFTPRCTVA